MKTNYASRPDMYRKNQNPLTSSRNDKYAIKDDDKRRSNGDVFGRKDARSSVNKYIEYVQVERSPSQIKSNLKERLIDDYGIKESFIKDYMLDPTNFDKFTQDYLEYTNSSASVQGIANLFAHVSSDIYNNNNSLFLGRIGIVVGDDEIGYMEFLKTVWTQSYMPTYSHNFNELLKFIAPDDAARNSLDKIYDLSLDYRNKVMPIFSSPEFKGLRSVEKQKEAHEKYSQLTSLFGNQTTYYEKLVVQKFGGKIFNFTRPNDISYESFNSFMNYNEEDAAFDALYNVLRSTDPGLPDSKLMIADLENDGMFIGNFLESVKTMVDQNHNTVIYRAVCLDIPFIGRGASYFIKNPLERLKALASGPGSNQSNNYALNMESGLKRQQTAEAILQYFKKSGENMANLNKQYFFKKFVDKFSEMLGPELCHDKESIIDFLGFNDPTHLDQYHRTMLYNRMSYIDSLSGQGIKTLRKMDQLLISLSSISSGAVNIDLVNKSLNIVQDVLNNDLNVIGIGKNISVPRANNNNVESCSVILFALFDSAFTRFIDYAFRPNFIDTMNAELRVMLTSKIRKMIKNRKYLERSMDNVLLKINGKSAGRDPNQVLNIFERLFIAFINDLKEVQKTDDQKTKKKFYECLIDFIYLYDEIELVKSMVSYCQEFMNNSISKDNIEEFKGGVTEIIQETKRKAEDDKAKLSIELKKKTAKLGANKTKYSIFGGEGGDNILEQLRKEKLTLSLVKNLHKNDMDRENYVDISTSVKDLEAEKERLLTEIKDSQKGIAQLMGDASGEAIKKREARSVQNDLATKQMRLQTLFVGIHAKVSDMIENLAKQMPGLEINDVNLEGKIRKLETVRSLYIGSYSPSEQAEAKSTFDKKYQGGIQNIIASYEAYVGDKTTTLNEIRKLEGTRDRFITDELRNDTRYKQYNKTISDNEKKVEKMIGQIAKLKKDQKNAKMTTDQKLNVSAIEQNIYELESKLKRNAASSEAVSLNGQIDAGDDEITLLKSKIAALDVIITNADVDIRSASSGSLSQDRIYFYEGTTKKKSDNYFTESSQNGSEQRDKISGLKRAVIELTSQRNEVDRAHNNFVDFLNNSNKYAQLIRDVSGNVGEYEAYIGQLKLESSKLRYKVEEGFHKACETLTFKVHQSRDIGNLYLSEQSKKKSEDDISNAILQDAKFQYRSEYKNFIIQKYGYVRNNYANQDWKASGTKAISEHFKKCETQFTELCKKGIYRNDLRWPRYAVASMALIFGTIGISMYQESSFGSSFNTIRTLIQEKILGQVHTNSSGGQRGGQDAGAPTGFLSKLFEWMRSSFSSSENSSSDNSSSDNSSSEKSPSSSTPTTKPGGSKSDKKFDPSVLEPKGKISAKDAEDYIKATLPFRGSFADKLKSKVPLTQEQLNIQGPKVKQTLGRNFCSLALKDSAQCAKIIKEVYKPFVEGASYVDSNRLEAANRLGFNYYNEKLDIRLDLANNRRAIKSLKENLRICSENMDRANYHGVTAMVSDESRECYIVEESLKTYLDLFLDKSEEEIRKNLNYHFPHVESEFYTTKYRNDLVEMVFKEYPIKESIEINVKSSQKMINALEKFLDSSAYKTGSLDYNEAQKKNIESAIEWAKSEHNALIEKLKRNPNLSQYTDTPNSQQESGKKKTGAEWDPEVSGEPTEQKPPVFKDFKRNPTTDGDNPSPTEDAKDFLSSWITYFKKVSEESFLKIIKSANNLSNDADIGKDIRKNYDNISTILSAIYSTGEVIAGSIYSASSLIVWIIGGISKVIGLIHSILTPVITILYNPVQSFRSAKSVVVNALDDTVNRSTYPDEFRIRDDAYDYVSKHFNDWKSYMSDNFKSERFNNDHVTDLVDQSLTEIQLQSLKDSYEKRRFRREVMFLVPNHFYTSASSFLLGFETKEGELSHQLITFLIKVISEWYIFPCIEKYSIFDQTEAPTSWWYTTTTKGLATVPYLAKAYKIYNGAYLVYSYLSGTKAFLDFFTAHTTDLIFYFCRTFSFLSNTVSETINSYYRQDSSVNKQSWFSSIFVKVFTKKLVQASPVDKQYDIEPTISQNKVEESVREYYYGLNNIIQTLNAFMSAAKTKNNASSDRSNPNRSNYGYSTSNSRITLTPEASMALDTYCRQKLERIGGLDKGAIDIKLLNMSTDSTTDVTRTKIQYLLDISAGTADRAADIAIYADRLSYLSELVQNICNIGTYLTEHCISYALRSFGDIVKPAGDIVNVASALTLGGLAINFAFSAAAIIAAVLYIYPQPHMGPKLMDCLSKWFLGYKAYNKSFNPQKTNISGKFTYQKGILNTNLEDFAPSSNDDRDDGDFYLRAPEFFHFLKTLNDYEFISSPDILNNRCGFDHYITNVMTQ